MSWNVSVRAGSPTGRRHRITSLYGSVRQTQRVKSRFSELGPVGPESLVHGNTGGKPPNYVADHIRDFVALQAMT